MFGKFLFQFRPACILDTSLSLHQETVSQTS
jgi:hypothetical protein